MMASVSFEPKKRAATKFGQSLNTLRSASFTKAVTKPLTRHELLFLLVKRVHDDVVACHVQERVILVNQVEAVLHIGVDSEEVACIHGDSLHGE